MIAERPHRRWRAWHVFSGDALLLDQVLISVCKPQVQRIAEDGVRWFYIRYWENGFHVRLRLLNIDDAQFERVGGALRRDAAVICAHAPVPAAPAQTGVRDGWHLQPEALPLFEPGTTVEILYEPEYRRYGGIHALDVNEDLFCASSTLALSIVSSTVDQPGVRQHIAMLLSAAAMGAITRHVPAGVTAMIMSEMWKSSAGDIEAENRRCADLAVQLEPKREQLTALLNGDCSSAPNLVTRWREAVDGYVGRVCELAERGEFISPLNGVAPRGQLELWGAVQSMLLSQIHMTNNRLGLAPLQEYRIGRVLAALQ